MPPAENERRSTLLLEDMTADQRPRSGVVTTREVKLTKARACADVPAPAVFSLGWDWTVVPVVGDSTRYHQLHGVIREGELDAGLNEDETPLAHLAARRQLNAVVRGTSAKAIRLPGDNDR